MSRTAACPPTTLNDPSSPLTLTGPLGRTPTRSIGRALACLARSGAAWLARCVRASWDALTNDHRTNHRLPVSHDRLPYGGLARPVPGVQGVADWRAHRSTPRGDDRPRSWPGHFRAGGEPAAPHPPRPPPVPHG